MDKGSQQLPSRGKGLPQTRWMSSIEKSFVRCEYVDAMGIARGLIINQKLRVRLSAVWPLKSGVCHRERLALSIVRWLTVKSQLLVDEPQPFRNRASSISHIPAALCRRRGRELNFEHLRSGISKEHRHGIRVHRVVGNRNLSS